MKPKLILNSQMYVSDVIHLSFIHVSRIDYDQ